MTRRRDQKPLTLRENKMINRRKAILTLSLYAGLIPGAAFAQGINGAAPTGGSVPTHSLSRTNHGHFLCTAAINANGTVASPLSEADYVDQIRTFRIAAGAYQVAFLSPCPNVQATNGWFRIVQPDTLTTGSTGPRFCTVADRAGLTSAVFVQCFNQAGVQTDTSFTISVSR
jgi:hypothetical protein